MAFLWNHCHVLQSIYVAGALYCAQWKWGESTDVFVHYTFRRDSSLTDSTFYCTTSKIFVHSNDFDRGDWWLYFPKDLVFPQNDCRVRHCAGMSPAVGGGGGFETTDHWTSHCHVINNQRCQLSQFCTCGPPRLSGVSLQLLRLPVNELRRQPRSTQTSQTTSSWLLGLVDFSGGGDVGCRSMNDVVDCRWSLLSQLGAVFIAMCWESCTL